MPFHFIFVTEVGLIAWQNNTTTATESPWNMPRLMEIGSVVKDFCSACCYDHFPCTCRHSNFKGSLSRVDICKYPGFSEAIHEIHYRMPSVNLSMSKQILFELMSIASFSFVNVLCGWSWCDSYNLTHKYLKWKTWLNWLYCISQQSYYNKSNSRLATSTLRSIYLEVKERKTVIGILSYYFFIYLSAAQQMRKRRV